MRPGRNTIWLIPLFLLVTFPLWSIPLGKFLAPRGGYDGVAQRQSTASHNFNMDTVKIVQNQDGRNTSIIRATHAKTGEKPGVYLMQDVNADLFDDEGKITNIVAQNGTYHSESKVLTLIKNVVVHKIDDRQFLYTDLLIYSSLQRTIRCPGKTRIIGDDVQIDGGTFDYDIKTKTYDLGNRVHTIIKGFVQP